MAPDWRNPIVLFPKARSLNWPNQNHTRGLLRYKGIVNPDVFDRSLVCIKEYSQHRFFETALDPWRIGCSENSDTAKTLPRPLSLLPLKITFSKMFDILQSRIEWSCGETNKGYFIPTVDWDPRVISISAWKNNTIFKRNTLTESRSKHNGRSGPVDRSERIWLWHEEEGHWDVQFPKGSDWSYWSISNNGTILRKHR